MARYLCSDMTAPREIPPLSVSEYEDWRGVIQEKIGVRLSANRADYLQRRLWARMGRLSISDYGDYYRHIVSGRGGAAEWQNLVDLVVNRQSGFFRHAPSFDALMEDVLPGLAGDRAGQKGGVRMWSAGCAGGQEAWSMAMACADVFGSRSDIPWRVIGTDISENALARAEAGEYAAVDIRDMPEAFRRRYMIEMTDESGLNKMGRAARMKPYRVAEALRSAVRFRAFNLIRRHDPRASALEAAGLSDQDVVFCQNVLIYFSPEDRAGSVGTLLRALKPGGRLFLGPGETAGLRIAGAVAGRFGEAAYLRRTEEEVHVRIVC